MLDRLDYEERRAKATLALVPHLTGTTRELSSLIEVVPELVAEAREVAQSIVVLCTELARQATDAQERVALIRLEMEWGRWLHGLPETPEGRSA